jgi:hypothetical protein
MKDLIKKLLRENLDKTITCEKCGWHWKASESTKKEMYICHKCGHDNTPKLKENNDLTVFKRYEDLLTKLGYDLQLDIVNNHLITIKIIEVPKDQRSKGKGSKILKYLQKLADDNNIVLKLIPGASSNFSRKKLINYYKNRGFIENPKLDYPSKENPYMHMYREPKKIDEELLNEAAVTLNDIPNDTGIYVEKTNLFLKATIYNPSEKKVYGMIVVSDINSATKNLGRIAAERGYGPLMCEIIMTYIYPSYLMPTRMGDIRPEALSIFEKFYQRSDIDKITLKPSDEEFETTLLTHLKPIDDPKEKELFFNSVSEENKKKLLIFNTKYRYKLPNLGKLKEMIGFAKESIKNGQTTMKEVSLGVLNYFSEKY